MRRNLAWLMAGMITCVSCTTHTPALGQRGRPVLALPAVTRRALTSALRELLAALPGDSAAVGLTFPGPAPAYWYSPEPRLLEELRTPAHRIVGPLQCPQTYDLMYVMVDSSGRNITPVRPPGYIDPYDVVVNTYQLVGGDSASISATAHQGTRNHHYACAARRDAAEMWSARCKYQGMSMSAVPPSETMQLTSARSSEAIAVSAYRDAGASVLASRISRRPLAAELRR